MKHQKEVSKTVKAKICKFFKSIETPKGFKRDVEFRESYNPWRDRGAAELKIFDDDIEIIFYVYLPDRRGEGLEVIGSTNYKHDGGWYTFDRRGIDDSFNMYEKPKVYKGWDPVPEEAWDAGNKMLESQILRCWEKIEHLKKTVVMPVLGFHITPERKEELTEKFKKGGSEQFVPGGMGTGHILSGLKIQFGEPAPKEICDFFGVKLYHQTFDYD